MTYPCCCPSRVFCDPDIKKYNEEYYSTRRGGSPLHYNQARHMDCPGHPGSYSGADCIPVNSPIPDGHYCDCKEDMYANWQLGTGSGTFYPSYESWRLNGPVDIMLSNWESYAPRGGCGAGTHTPCDIVPRVDCWSLGSHREWGTTGCSGHVMLKWNRLPNESARPTIHLSWDLWCKNPGNWGDIGSLEANCEPYGTPFEPAVRLGLPDGTEDPKIGGWLFKCEVRAFSYGLFYNAQVHRDYYDWWIDGDSATSHGDKVFGLPEGPIVPKLVYDQFHCGGTYDYRFEEGYQEEDWLHGCTPFVVPEFTWDVMLHIKPQVAIAAGLLSALASTEDIANHYRPHLVGRTVGNVAVAAEVPE